MEDLLREWSHHHRFVSKDLTFYDDMEKRRKKGTIQASRLIKRKACKSKRNTQPEFQAHEIFTARACGAEGGTQRACLIRVLSAPTVTDGPANTCAPSSFPSTSPGTACPPSGGPNRSSSAPLLRMAREAPLPGLCSRLVLSWNPVSTHITTVVLSPETLSRVNAMPSPVGTTQNGTRKMTFLPPHP